MRRGALAFVVAAAIVAGFVVAPVGAAEAAAPKSAQRFADAVLRVKERIVAARAVVSAAFEIDFQACVDFADADEEVGELPSALEERVGLLFAGAIISPVVGPTRTAFDQLIADLDEIPTREPTLRAGREAWRQEVAAIRRFPLIDRPCAKLDAWRTAGYAVAATPPVPFDAIDAYLTPNAEVRRNARRLDAAGRRLQRLGVSAAAARRFTGRGLYDPIWDGDEFGDAMPPRTAFLPEPD